VSDDIVKGSVAIMVADAYSKIKNLEKENGKLKQQLAERDELIIELNRKERLISFNMSGL
jgi:hypothetical protein